MIVTDVAVRSEMRCFYRTRRRRLCDFLDFRVRFADAEVVSNWRFVEIVAGVVARPDCNRWGVRFGVAAGPIVNLVARSLVFYPCHLCYEKRMVDHFLKLDEIGEFGDYRGIRIITI